MQRQDQLSPQEMFYCLLVVFIVSCYVVLSIVAPNYYRSAFIYLTYIYLTFKKLKLAMFEQYSWTLLVLY